mgnify:CR=1 FL=1
MHEVCIIMKILIYYAGRAREEVILLLRIIGASNEKFIPCR